MPVVQRRNLICHARSPRGERFGLAVLPAVLPRLFLAAVLAERGESAEAIAVGEEGLRIAQIAGHPYSEAQTRYGLGWAICATGTSLRQPGCWSRVSRSAGRWRFASARRGTA